MVEDGIQSHLSGKELANHKSKIWYYKNKKRALETKRVRREDARYSMLEAAKSRAKKHNLPFDISLEDIIIPEVCPVFGLKLEKSLQKAGDNSPSLDRITPELGYVKGNIQVISYKANVVKNNLTKEQLLKFATWVLNG